VTAVVEVGVMSLNGAPVRAQAGTPEATMMPCSEVLGVAPRAMPV
jgi:hypothetical protein